MLDVVLTHIPSDSLSLALSIHIYNNMYLIRRPASLHDAFPAHMLQARVSVLSKVSEPTHPSDARPITIMCNLYRVWSRVLVTQTLMQWSHRLPNKITGCVKGRSSSDLAYTCSVRIEQALSRHCDLSGISVDLSKAFNHLARSPLAELLCWLGMPRPVVQFWQRCLSRVTRCFQVGRSLSVPVESSTGAPEGDPTSVIGMIAVCTALVLLLVQSSPDVSPHFSVDNWSWMSAEPAGHGLALRELQSFTNSMRMAINWATSYSWSVHPSSRRWLKRELCGHLPDGVTLPVLSHVRELGVQLQFGRKICLQHVVPKMEAAVSRFRKLFHDPCPLHVKARVIPSGILPHAFFGSFNAAPGQAKVHRLRSHAARALVGRHHTMSPFAALFMFNGLMVPEVFLLWSHARALRRFIPARPQWLVCSG